MNDMVKIAELLEKYNIDFHTTLIYDETNQPCGWAVWLSKGGHIEFGLDKMIKKIVTY